MLVGRAGPLVLTNASDTPGVILGIAVLAVGLGLFFLSLRRLNRQMIAVKQREVGLACDLYMQAYEGASQRWRCCRARSGWSTPQRP
jgi:hypothetical protein